MASGLLGLRTTAVVELAAALDSADDGVAYRRQSTSVTAW